MDDNVANFNLSKTSKFSAFCVLFYKSKSKVYWQLYF